MHTDFYEGGVTVDWINYIIEKRETPYWGGIALDYYSVQKTNPQGHENITPKSYLNWIIDEIYTPEVEIVQFHKIFLGVCVRLLGNDFDTICQYSWKLLSISYPKSIPDHIVTEVEKVYSEYHMSECFVTHRPREYVQDINSLDESRIKTNQSYQNVDVAIITVLPEEYHAVLAECGHQNCSQDPGVVQPNACAWKVAIIKKADSEQQYKVAIACAGRSGTLSGHEVTKKTVERYNSQYVLLVGIAGGFPEDDLCKGDVVVSKIIYGYDYGKIGKGGFKPRNDLIYNNISDYLFRAAVVLGSDPISWTEGIKQQAPIQRTTPKIIPGNIASGDKVVDDPSDEFWQSVKNAWDDKIHAVEMEGLGAAHAAKSLMEDGKVVRFLMLRGISDMPQSSENGNLEHNQQRTKERDLWKQFASASAARFAIELIRREWPEAPES